jgi:hypothetical protein
MRDYYFQLELFKLWVFEFRSNQKLKHLSSEKKTKGGKMGVYNTYAGVQLKVESDCDLREYQIGDKVTLLDGIYVGNEGFAVIISGVLVSIFPMITTKWGDLLDPENVLKNSNLFNLKKL